MRVINPCRLTLISHCPFVSRLCCLCIRYALPETFLLLPLALLIGIPAYQVFIKGDAQKVATGELGEGLASGDGLAGQSDNVDLNEPNEPPPVEVVRIRRPSITEL